MSVIKSALYGFFPQTEQKSIHLKHHNIIRKNKNYKGSSFYYIAFHRALGGVKCTIQVPIQSPYKVCCDLYMHSLIIVPLSVQLCSSAMCRMSKHFDNPDTFNPDRFAPGNKRYYPLLSQYLLSFIYNAQCYLFQAQFIHLLSFWIRTPLLFRETLCNGNHVGRL